MNALEAGANEHVRAASICSISRESARALVPPTQFRPEPSRPTGL